MLDVSNDVAAELASIGDGILEALRERLKINILLRGNRLTIAGDDVRVAEARAVVDELVELVETGQEIGPATVDAVVKALDQAENVQDVFGDVVWRHRGKQITPKTVTQKRYVEAIRNCTVTFGIGPAGTGKTYLAMALAVAALQDRQVARIILTRPAVEAGERLGFLPGDLLAKVDPYLRPLFDALYDMLDAERLNTYMERGTVEVAPLAYMRGRTLNDSFIILDEAQNTTPEQMQMFLTRLGFLPGDMLAKVDPYLRPLFDALYDMLDAERLNTYMERGTIEVAPLAFMRGRTLNDSFIILDEAQNTSPEQMQMFLTRLGFGSKVVVTGDVTQVDLPREQASGLIQVQDILSSIDGIAFIRFGHEDVVRHKLVQRIVEAYKLHAEETGTARQK